MQLDFVENINAYGDNIIRLYDFNSIEAQKFIKIFEHSILKDKTQLNLAAIDFIEARNCSLSLRITDEDFGIISDDNKIFYCDMTLKSYKQMLLLMKPYGLKDIKAHQFLYDVDSLTDFLFSPVGSWGEEEED